MANVKDTVAALRRLLKRISGEIIQVRQPERQPALPNRPCRRPFGTIHSSLRGSASPRLCVLPFPARGIPPRANELPIMRFRQIHLDFHTSPLIPDVGRDFDPEAFAATFRFAHCDSVTVFGKCHHGMCYYPTKIGPKHPSLDRDLMGKQIEALHKVGIKAPIYLTCVWESSALATRWST